MAKYTDEQKKQLLDLIEKWKKKLRLQHWRIEVNWDDEPAHDNCLLEVFVQPEIHYAGIRVGDFFDSDISDEERDNAVCHELIHIHVQPLMDTVDGLLAELGNQAKSHMRQVVRYQVEQMIDAIATSFVPLD